MAESVFSAQSGRYRYDDLSFESCTTNASKYHPKFSSSDDTQRRDTSSTVVSRNISLPKIFDISISSWLIPVSVLLGVVFGLIIDGDSDLSDEYRPVSSVLGWTYFFAWSLSFYPQILLNFTRKNSMGFHTDKLVYDFIGFGCFSVYAFAFRYVNSVRSDYEDEHHGNSPTVEVNDVAFGFHAVAMTLIQIGQVIRYNGLKQSPTRLCILVASVVCSVIVLYLGVCLLADSSVFIMLNWLYFLSIVKIGVTFVKYVPQVLLNYKRRSTVGWSITTSGLDALGSTLSILQLVLDAHDKGDMADGIWGNFVKLALGSISLVFDAIFFWQYFVLYPSREDRGEYAPLLDDGLSKGDETTRDVRNQLFVTASGDLVHHEKEGRDVVVADESLWDSGGGTGDNASQ